MTTEEKELIKLYNETLMTLEEISKVVGISRNNCAALLQKNDVVGKSKRIEIAKKLYRTKEYSLTKLSEKLGMSRPTLTKYLKEDETINIFNPLKIYEYNEEYFKNIDCDEKAYWLGFICADGCVVENPTYLSLDIGLKYSDKNHLIKFLKALDFNESDIEKKIRAKTTRLSNKVHKSCSVTIHNTQMCKDLIELGVVPRKSLVMRFPTKVKQELIPAFIRGYIDGDGGYYIGYRRDGSKSVRLYLVATEQFLNGFYDYYRERVTPTKLLSKQGTIVLQISKSGDEAEYIIKDIYKGATVYLDRKYEKIKYLLSE